MEVGETLYVVSREDWRAWLAAHHQDKREIWLIAYRKATGKPTLSYDEAVEEALCFGWIDSQEKPLDAERFARRFTPRRKGSGWAASNRARALKMLRAGQMTPAGLAVLPADMRPGTEVPG